MNSFSEHTSPKEENIIGLEISSHYGEEIWNETNENIFEICMKGIAKDSFLKLKREDIVDYKIIKQRLKQVKDTDPNTFLNVFRIYANTEMKSWLHKISVPTLVLTGENDKGCNPKLNQFMANQLMNSKLIILPNFKHSILIEAPNLVSKNLNNFFTNNH